MSSSSIEEAEWATAPLLDPANVGKKVWVRWNGNKPSLTTISKIGRTNVVAGMGRGESYRVEPSGDMAISRGAYTSVITTESHRLAFEYRTDLERAVKRRLMPGNWWNASSVTNEQLKDIAFILGEEVGS